MKESCLTAETIEIQIRILRNVILNLKPYAQCYRDSPILNELLSRDLVIHVCPITPSISQEYGWVAFPNRLVFG